MMTDKLWAVVNKLKEKPMENKNVLRARDEFMEYIQSTLIDGVFNLDMWSCFDRRSNHTNNVQEAYNSVFNR